MEVSGGGGEGVDGGYSADTVADTDDNKSNMAERFFFFFLKEEGHSVSKFIFGVLQCLNWKCGLVVRECITYVLSAATSRTIYQGVAPSPPLKVRPWPWCRA